MAEKSLNVKTEEIYGRNPEKGKELQNYQDAEKQLLAIQAAQQQNLRTAKTANLAQFQNNQNLASAGEALSQAAGSPQTQQVAVNPATQQILQKYGASKPGTVTKTTHSQQVTKQNITINNNTTNTTNNQVTTPPAQQQVIRPQKDNSNEKFKIWLNNTLARQQEEYSRREKDYDKRENALERDSNKMLRKLGEFSKDMMEKMDPRKIGSTTTSQIKSLLFIFGFQYLASNWTKILKTVANIENSIKSGLTYFGLYKRNKDGSGNFCFEPGKSQLAMDLKGLFTGIWEPSTLWGTIGITKGGKITGEGVLGGENGMIGGLRKVLLGNVKEGGKDKGLIELIKEFFVNQGKKRMAAAKMIDKPDFNIGNIEGSIRNLGDYLGQLLGIFLGDPDEAVRNMMKSKISISAAQKAWSYIDNNSTGEKFDEVDRGGRKIKDVKQGVAAYFQGEDSQRGLSLGALDKDGNLRHTDAEGSISQSSDLTMVHEDAVNGKRIDTERYAAGMARLSDDIAANGGKTAVTNDFLRAYLSESEIQELERQGKLKRNVEYDYAVRDVDVQDDEDYYGFIGREEEKELKEYLDAGLFGDKSNVVSFLTRILGPGFAGLAELADLIYRLCTGKYDSIMDLKSIYIPLKKFGMKAIKIIKFLATHFHKPPLLWILELFEKDPDKPGLGTEKRKVLLSKEQQKSSDVLLAKKEYVTEISQDVLDFINAKGGITSNIDMTSTEYYDQVQNSLAMKYAKNNKELSAGETDKTYTTSDGTKRTVHLSAEEASVLENTGYYIGADKDYAQFVNEKKYREERDAGNREFEESVMGKSVHDSYTGSTYHYGGIMDQAYEESMTDLTSMIEKDKSLQDFYSISEKSGKGEGFSTAITGLSSNWRGNKTISNTLQATDSDGNVHNIEQLYTSLKNESPEKIREAYNSLLNMNFNAGNDIVSTLSSNTGLKKHWVSLFSNIYSRGLEGDDRDGRVGGITEINFEELLKDPEGYGQKLIDNILKTMPKNPQGLFGQVDNDTYKHAVERFELLTAHKQEAIKHIYNLVSYFRTFLDNVDVMIGEKRKAKVLEAFSRLMNSRASAVATKTQDLHLANEYATNDYKRTVASAKDPMLRMSYSRSGGEVNEILDNYGEFKSEWDAKDQQYEQDLRENAVTSKAMSIIDGVKGKLQGVMDTFDEYSEEAKTWFGSLFKNAKDVVNGFLRNLDYTKVSMARWPYGYIVREKDGLLLWHCMNNNPSVRTDFMVKGSDGRFGAGRLSHRTDSDKAAKINVWDPHVDSEENQRLGIAGLYDRIHSGQDISGIYVNDKQVAGLGTPFYAPFNGYITHLKDYKKGFTNGDSGSGRQVMIRQKKEGSTSGGRYSVFVCHLSSVSQYAKDAFANGTLFEKGKELGRMGGSGTKEDSYGPHFHVNIIDHEGGGPFDGPLDGDLPGIVSGYEGFTLSTTKGAVDPLFVFCDSDTSNIKNRTLYMSSDKKVVYLDDADPSKVDRYKGGDLDMAPSGEGDSSTGEGKSEEEEGIVTRIWNKLKEMATNLMTGNFQDLFNPVKETLGEAKTEAGKLWDNFFGRYRNKSVSFRESSRSYTGNITKEFVNYQNYKNNPGKIGLGPDGQPLTELQWRNKVFDMVGADPSAIHIGEFVRGTGDENLKTASEVGGEAEQVITKNSTSATTNSEVTNEGNSSSVVNESNVTYNKSSEPLWDWVSLNKDIQRSGKNPIQQTADSTQNMEDSLYEIKNLLDVSNKTAVLVGETTVKSLDVNNALTQQAADKQCAAPDQVQVVRTLTSDNGGTNTN